MIICTTIGRSGSSFLALFFKNCGLDIGGDRWFKTFKAGMENKKALAINAMLVSHLIKCENINIYEAWSGIHSLNSDLAKDPQFMMHPDIIENWWHVRKDIKIIYLDRDFKKIAESQKKVPEWTGPVYRCFPEMMVKQERAFLDRVAELEIPIKRFTFPDFLYEPNTVINQLKEWVDLPDDAPEIWDKLIDGNKH